MAQLERLIVALPEDPLALAMTLVLVWLPMCALVLLVLSGTAFAQNWLRRRQRPGTALLIPTGDMRPLTSRRYVTASPRARGLLSFSAARIGLAIFAVLGFTALILASSYRFLMSTGRG